MIRCRSNDTMVYVGGVSQVEVKRGLVSASLQAVGHDHQSGNRARDEDPNAVRSLAKCPTVMR